MLSGGCPHPPVAPVPARDGQRQRKEKQRQCDNHPDDLRTIRHGTAVPEIAEDDSVPEGRPKSALAPIRRPRRAEARTRRSASKRSFSFGPCTARFLFHKREKKMGCIRWTSPLREQNPPWPPDGGPSHVTPARRSAPADNLWSRRSNPPGPPISHSPAAVAALIALVRTQLDTENFPHVLLCDMTFSPQFAQSLRKFYHKISPEPLDTHNLGVYYEYVQKRVLMVIFMSET